MILVLAAVLLATLLYKSQLYICGPNEILVLSGRVYKTEDGRRVNYRVVYSGGQAVRFPFLEAVKRLSVSPMSVSLCVKNAYSKASPTFDVEGVAKLRVSTNPQLVDNAIDRFLGKDRCEICRVARETIEGHLRSVFAATVPSKIKTMRVAMASELAELARPDLAILGLHLETLTIERVVETTK